MRRQLGPFRNIAADVAKGQTNKLLPNEILIHQFISSFIHLNITNTNKTNNGSKAEVRK